MSDREVIRLEDIWVRYDGIPVLQGVTLIVKDNEFLGLIGPNGGGKTTLLRVILGLVKPVWGRVTVLGEPPRRNRHLIGYVPQHNFFDRDFPVNVREIVLMGRNGRRGLLSRYNEDDKERAGNALKMVGMLDQQNRQIGRLSGGEQQRVFIARALVGEPKVLLLDEPTASVDTTTQTDFYEMLEDLRQQMPIVLVSHDISAVSVYVDKIACLNRQLFYHGSPEIEAEVLEATYKCPVQMLTHGEIPHRVLKDH